MTQSNSNVSDLLTIESLKETVKALEENKLNLLVTINELKEKLTQEKADQADIYFFLNKKCDESFEIIATLEEQLLNEQADREIAEKLYETKIEELRVSAGNTEARLLAKVNELEGKLEMLSGFAETKDETERIMKELMSKLDDEREQFRVNADTMENRFLLEREKLRKSYDIKYESLKKDLEASMDGKLSKKTQRTQIMNVVMKKELDTQVFSSIYPAIVVFAFINLCIVSPCRASARDQSRSHRPGEDHFQRTRHIERPTARNYVETPCCKSKN